MILNDTIFLSYKYLIIKIKKRGFLLNRKPKGVGAD